MLVWIRNSGSLSFACFGRNLFDEARRVDDPVPVIGRRHNLNAGLSSLGGQEDAFNAAVGRTAAAAIVRRTSRRRMFILGGASSRATVPSNHVRAHATAA